MRRPFVAQREAERVGCSVPTAPQRCNDWQRGSTYRRDGSAFQQDILRCLLFVLEAGSATAASLQPSWRTAWRTLLRSTFLWRSLSPLSLTAAAVHLQDTMITAPHPPVFLYQTTVMSSSKHSSIDVVDNASGQLIEASSQAVVARDLFGRDWQIHCTPCYAHSRSSSVMVVTYFTVCEDDQYVHLLLFLLLASIKLQ